MSAFPKKESAVAQSRAKVADAAEHELHAAGSAPQTGANQLLECVAVLSRYHGVHVSPAALLETAHPGGQFAEDAAVPALTALDFRCAWVEPARDLLGPGHCPLILKRADGTYVVVLEIADRQAQVFDAATATTSSQSLADLEHAGMQRILLASPPAADSSRGDFIGRPGSNRWFWGSLWKFRRSFAEAIFLTIVVNLLALSMTVLTMSVYDRVLPNQAYVTLQALSIGAMISVLFEFGMRQWRATLLDRVGKKVDLLLGSLVFRHVMHMRLETQQGQSTGAFAHTIREYESLRDFVTSLTLTMLADLPFMIFFLGVIAYIGGALAWVPTLGVLVVMISLLVAQVPLSRLMREGLRETAARSGLVVESLTALQMLKALRAETVVARQHDRISERNSQIAMKTRLVSNLVANISSAVQQICTVGILFWGVYRVGESLATAGSIVATVMLMGRAMQPVSGLAGLAVRFQQARTSLHSLGKIMNRPLERQPGISYFHRSKWEGRLAASSLSFSYGPNLPDALRDIDIVIRPGEKVGIIGKMGSGKSTLLKMLAGLHQPSGGEVVLDGLDLRHIDVADIRRSLRALPQEVLLMQGSLLDNLRLAAPHASDERILEAVRMTGVVEFASRHPLGLNMPVGEGGRMLSGGQRQAVALAQVALSDARVLLLDEPTASMDQASEQLIHHAIARTAEGRTLIAVTHKAALLALVDRVIVVDLGRVVMDGPRDAVLQRLSAAAARQTPPGSAAASTSPFDQAGAGA